MVDEICIAVDLKRKGENVTPDWIAVDWGTSNLRVWAMDKDGNVLAQTTLEKGMSSLAPNEFEPTLLSVIKPWISSPIMIVACGMVGAKQGWSEAAYLQTPCNACDTSKIITAPADDLRLSVQILPGISQNKPADVMRGEETQLAGLIAENPTFDGVVCLPGTHTKWVRISAEEVVNFTTFMTGEIFSLIAEQSVLCHSIGEGWDHDAFDQALSDAISRPEAFASKLFALRAETLLSDLTPNAARARLSGLLIGLELAAARQYWLGQNVAIIGTETLAKTYQSALQSQGLRPVLYNAENLTLKGLTAAYKDLK